MTTLDQELRGKVPTLAERVLAVYRAGLARIRAGAQAWSAAVPAAPWAGQMPALPAVALPAYAERIARGLRAALPALASLTFLLAAVLVLFRDAILDGQVFYRSDTLLYYYPIADRMADVLRDGRLMLWTPYLFGGFPLFADGEAGMLYPPNLVAYLLLPEQQAFIWLRVLRYFLAAAFTFAYLRTFRLNHFAAVIGALSFSFGSFMIGQMHHSNLANTAIWLPLVLTFIELAVRSVRRRRWFYATCAGASLGVQSLGLHVQPLILTGFFLAMYVPFRVLLCPIAWPEGWKPWVPRSLGRRAALFAGFAVSVLHRGLLALLLLVLVPVTALGLAAAQVVPLLELATFSFRGRGVSYQFATSFSMPVQNLVNLVLPYFFRYTNRQWYWSLWTEWETTIYVGVACLALALLAAVFVRNRLVPFFAFVAVVSVLLAFGGYSPVPLYDQVRHWPGFSALRVPARFTMLTTFSLAVLAAFGVDWLCRTLRPGTATPSTRWTRLSRAVAVHGLPVYLMGLLVAAGGIVWWLASFRMWIEKDPGAVQRLVQERYLSLRNIRPWLTPETTLNYLSYSLDLTNPSTTLPVGLILATFLLLFAWLAFRRLWRVWASALVLLVAGDMLLFSSDFHPAISMSQLSKPNSATEWLMSQNVDGRQRVFTSLEAHKTEANKMLPFRVPEITGYSSLETKRHEDYVARLREYEKGLMDLYSVRFVVLPRRPSALPSYEHTSYNPYRPLADGPRDGRNAHATYYMNPPVKTDEVLIISNLREAADIPQGAEVGEIVVVDSSGERVPLKVRAGEHTAEWAADRSDVVPLLRHSKVRVADGFSATDLEGRPYKLNLYLGEIKLDKTRTVERVEFRYQNPKGKMRLYGMMLWENPWTAHQVLGRNKFIPRYEDEEVAIFENPSRLPQAYLVPAARVLNRADVLDTIAQGSFDPERVVLLESQEGQEGAADPSKIDPQALEGWDGARPAAGIGTAEIVEYRSTDVRIRTSSERNAWLFLADSFYPGWKAFLDGRETKIYRADHLFRTVQLPAGQHDVRFVFEPESFASGVRLSGLTLVILVLAWTALLGGPALYFWMRRAPKRAWNRARRLAPVLPAIRSV